MNYLFFIKDYFFLWLYFVLYFGICSPIYLFCLTFCLCFYELGEIATSSGLEDMGLYRSIPCVNSLFWAALTEWLEVEWAGTGGSWGMPHRDVWQESYDYSKHGLGGFLRHAVLGNTTVLLCPPWQDSWSSSGCRPWGLRPCCMEATLAGLLELKWVCAGVSQVPCPFD